MDLHARPDWHSLSVESALAAAQTTPNGLSDREATRRFATIGANRIVPPEPVSALKILRDQLTGVIVVLLVAAAAISVGLGDYVEAAAIAAVLAINTAIGFATEFRARRAMEALRQLDVARASVIRDGHVQVVDADRLVPGDVVEVVAGHAIPADARLIAGTDLRVNEAALTGESLPVSKSPAAVLDVETALAERANMVFKGTTVVAGLGRGVVTGTGPRSEIGRIGTLTGSVETEPTPLERRLDALGRRLVWLTLGVAALVALLGALQNVPPALMIETAIALAVAAVPEALPAVATIALAVGMRRMARRHALVRRLPVVETLGSTTVVCTDKTRTLTSGEMTVVRVWTSSGDWDPLNVSVEPDHLVQQALRAAAFASRHQADDDAGPLRDPVDAAIVEAAGRLAVESYRDATIGARVGMIPFASDRKWMAGFYEIDRALVAFAKGAPQAILDRTAATLTSNGEVPLNDTSRARLARENDRLASQGLRVLAVASGRVDRVGEETIRGLTFLGLLGLADPPAAGVAETIARLRGAGLRTIMLTGDQRLTAEAVGRAVGLLGANDASMDGRAIDRLDGAGLDAAVAGVSTFSRVTPEHKLMIVRALQARGDVVAMLGDGINDAAALKRADVGVAMGIRGTDVAKEASAIVLQDDRFETIVAAVEEGRIIFDNIRKFIFYLFSCNLAEVMVLFATAAAGMPLPLAPLQLLWLNMVTDTFPALALAIEPGDTDVMRRPPRDPKEAILSRAFLIGVFLYAVLITLSTIGAFAWGLAYAPERASTLAFMTLALAQIGHLGNARSDAPVLALSRALANPHALIGVALALAVQGLAIAVAPLADALHLVRLGPSDWMVVVTLGSLPAVSGQLAKAFRVYDRGRGRTPS